MRRNEIGSDLPSLVVMVVSAWSSISIQSQFLRDAARLARCTRLRALSFADAEKGALMIPLAIPEAAVWPGASACRGLCSREGSRKPRPPCGADPSDMRSLPERSRSWVPPSFHSSSHCPHTRVPVCLPIGADRQGRLVPRSRVKRLDSHKIRSMRGARAQLVGMRGEITNPSGAFSRPLALSYHGAPANRANDSSRDEGDDSYTLIWSRRV